MQELQATLPMGAVVGNRYIIEELLGKGGFGAVYLVKDQRVRGNLFALKEVIDADKKERLRFAFEGEVLKRLDSPALPRVYRAFDDEKRSRAYILMDYIAGPNLETLRQQQPERRFPLAKALSMMAPIFEAVSFLHQQKPPIIHRDVKPANIIVPTADDSTVLVDFGIAKEYDPDSTTTAVRRCSPGYGAPEQYSMGTNTRTDIYGLGATLYALLTGDIPEDAFYRMTQMSNNNADPLIPVKRIVPSIPLAVSQAIERAMAINSNERFASVEEFWQTLNAYSAQRETPIPAAPLVAPYETTVPNAPNTPRPPVYEPVNRPQVNVVPVPVRQALPPGGSGETTRKRRRLLPLILLALAILLFAGTAAALGLLFATSGHQTAHTPTPVATHHSGITPTAKATATAKPTATPTTAPTATPTTPPAPPTAVPTTPPAPVYPQVAGVHSGSVTNTNNHLTGSMTLSLQQSQSAISGNVTINYPLSGSGPITYGYVTTGNAIRFIVRPNGLAPLYFYGNVLSGGSMSGSYCSLNSQGNCDPNVGGQGYWNANAVSPGGS